MNNLKVCQSCGMPLEKDPNKNELGEGVKYCSFCFRNGEFLDKELTLEKQIEKNVQIAVSQMGMPETQAREMAEKVLPTLERWKS